MKQVISSVLLFAALSATTFASPSFNQKRIIVKMKEGKALPSSSHILRSKLLFGRIFVLYTDDSQSLISELRTSDRIEYVEKDYYAGKRTLPKLETIEADSPELTKYRSKKAFNDPLLSKVWSFKDAKKKGISVNRTYNEMPNTTGAEIIVAVVDTGVTYDHEDLKDVMWINDKEIPGNGIDDDNNGYIDDVHGINTLVRDAEGNATGDPRDQHSHGTHVSGTIAATQNNGIGIAGIASHVKIMAIRTVPNNGDELDIDVIESFLYAAKHGAKIINCSFGKAHNEGGMAVKEAIDFIGKEYGVLVIAAAGNSSRDIDKVLTYPASFESDNLLVVASTTKRGGMSYFSNFGKKNVDLAAPGSAVYSTTPRGYGSMSGTSMACPTTVGVAAEVLSRHPELGPVELKNALLSSVTPIGRFTSKLVSGGRVDLFQTLDNL